MRMLKLLSLVIGIWLGLAASVMAADVSVGMGAAWQSSPYKDYDGQFMPFPLLSVEGERFYLRGPDVGAHLVSTENHALSLGLAYFGQEFDSGDTDDLRLRLLDDRDATVNAYIQYTLTGEFGKAGIKLAHDILGKSRAASGEVFYKHPIYLDRLTLSPGLGAVWESKDQLDYYYGVTARESRKSGLREYSPGAGISPFLSMEASVQITENFRLIAAGRALFLSKEIKDSPMVENGQVFRTMVGFSYSLQ